MKIHDCPLSKLISAYLQPLVIRLAIERKKTGKFSISNLILKNPYGTSYEYSTFVEFINIGMLSIAVYQSRSPDGP